MKRDGDDPATSLSLLLILPGTFGEEDREKLKLAKSMSPVSPSPPSMKDPKESGCRDNSSSYPLFSPDNIPSSPPHPYILGGSSGIVVSSVSYPVTPIGTGS